MSLPRQLREAGLEIRNCTIDYKKILMPVLRKRAQSLPDLRRHSSVVGDAVVPKQSMGGLDPCYAETFLTDSCFEQDWAYYPSRMQRLEDDEVKYEGVSHLCYAEVFLIDSWFEQVWAYYQTNDAAWSKDYVFVFVLDRHSYSD